MLCHILKTGTFKDSKGNEHTFTTSDLDKIADRFKNNHNRVPICVGHPKTNSPAYGWFNSVKRIGDNLYCDFKNVQDEFKNAVKQGLFKNRSISLDSDLNIRHLAFLGGQAPAIKGLEEFCFADCEPCVKIHTGSVSEPFDGEQFKTAEIETEIEISTFEDNFEEENNGKDNQVTTEELQKQLDSANAENERLKAELEAKKQAEITKDFEDFCSEAIKNGNILPKHKESVINILHACNDFGTFNFADKEDVNAVDAAKDFIKSIKIFDFEDSHDNGREIMNFADYDGDAWAKEIKKIAEENKVSAQEAIQIIKRRK